jgi:hypothetical protein
MRQRWTGGLLLCFEAEAAGVTVRARSCATARRHSKGGPSARAAARISGPTMSRTAAIPTLYGGTSFNCASMETVFHDVPFSSGLKAFAGLAR